MGSSTRSLKDLKDLQGDTAPPAHEEIVALTSSIKDTRSQMGNTLEEIHGILNPAVFKEEILKQFHDAKEGLKKELSADLVEAKEAIKTGIAETKESLKEGILETKETLAENVKEEISDAKSALRAATIGKVETMVENAKVTAKETGKSISTTVSENPIPVALVGIGVAWLLASRLRKSGSLSTGPIAQAIGSGTDLIKEKASGLIEGAEHLAKDAGSFAKNAEKKIESKIGSVAGAASGAVGGLVTGAKSSVVDAVHTASDTVSHLADDAVVQGGRLKDGAFDLYDKNPLVFGAAVAAVGAAIGLAVPITSSENRLMGGARAVVFEKAEAIAHDALGKVDQVAKQLSEGDKGEKSEKSDKQEQKADGNPRTERDGRDRSAKADGQGRPAKTDGADRPDPKMGEDEPAEERYGFEGSAGAGGWPSSRT